MCWTVLQVLALLKLTAQSAAETGCAGDQRCFRGSCYEFVGREVSFHDAQHWCEDRGGHLAVIPDKGTQHFLERHLNFKNDTWIGLPFSSSSKQQYYFNDGGPQSWWNGSHVLYSKRAGAVCGHLSGNLSFHWETTGNCTKKKTFICQFKSRRSVVFPGDSRTLLCSSGQTLIIDGGFYGHKNRPSRLSSPTATQDECGWVDVLDSIKDICQGRRVCQLTRVVNSVRKLCPEPSRYLTVHYRCVEGTNVVYRIQRGEELLAGMSVVQGSISQNITVTPKMVQKLGSGCHKLTLHASNMVTFPEVSRDLQVCIVEEISGLRAAVVRESCVRPHGALGVSLTRGAPVQLFFSLTGDHGSFSETKRMNSKRRVFHIRHPIRALLKKNGQLSGQRMGQLITSVANKLNDQSVESTEQERLKLRELMLQTMINAIQEALVSTPVDVQVVARGLEALVQKGSELTLPAQKNISDVLLGTLSNTQSALLTQKEINEGPTIVNQSQISMLVSRVTTENLHRESLSVANSSRPAFSLPELPPNMFSTEKSVDIRILLPRDPGEPESSSVLDLGNYSTTVIDVPSADTTLVLKLLPSVDPLPFKVFLGHMDYPTQSNFVAMTQMPQQGLTQEERYTWLLDPKLLKGNTGLHYLVVRPIVGPGVKSINASLSVSSITSSCKFWNETQLDWSDSGCRVGVKSTHLVTQCLCNHLTFFGSSFFVTPNLVDPSRTAELFANFAENPVVVCFVGALFVAFLLVVVWARRKDIQDKVKVKVTVLEDNDPMERYCYLLSVSTGHRIGASTSAKVVVTLLGSRQNSEPHHLTDQKKHLFERGAVDLFLLTTPFSLGELQGIRLWHDNSGSHPAWYVGNIMVKDLQTEEKWHFLCNSWLAIDLGDCCLDKVFPASTETDLKSFSMKTTKDFSDGHLWYSVIGRPANSSFTCVQRVSCCFSLLLCTMLTSIMFYGIPEDPSDQVMDLGHFEFTWQQFMIGVQSSLIMFPVNILIVAVFRNTRPRETPCCQRQTEKTNQGKQIALQEENALQIVPPKTEKNNLPCAGFEVADINALLSKVEAFLKEKDETSNETKSPLPASTPEGIPADSYEIQYLHRQLCHTEKELASSSADPHSHQALQKVRHMKSSLQARLIPSGSTHLHEPLYDNYRSVPADGAATAGGQKRKVCCSGMLPWWFIFVGWLLVIGTSCVSGYFIMLYGLKFGKERSISWLVSTIVSFFQSILLIQPLKVVGLAVFFALVIKKVDDEDLQNVTFESMNKNQGHFGNVQMSRRDVGLYEPPPSADVQIMKRNRVLEQRAFGLLREILAYVGFMWMLLLVAYGQRDPNAFFLNQHIRKSFTDSVPESMSLQDVFTWANTSLLTNLFGNYPGFITDGNSKLVGNARLRQLRVQKNQCQVGDPVLALVAECHAPYVGGVEDMGSYEPGWNRTVNDNSSENASGPWRYRTQAQLRAQPFWGRMGLYRGGGFVVELGPDLSNASSTLEYLFRNKWLDVYTRAIFVEFTVYNANVNLFCIVTLLMETSAVGAFQFSSDLQSVRLYQSTGGLYFFVMAAEIVYMLFILYYMVLQGKLLKQQGWVYFKNKWNLLDLSIILLSWSALAFFIMRTLLGNRDMSFYQKNKDQFASFYETASADLMFQYLIAFIVLLATVKLWHLLRLNPKMNLITAALQRAWSDISGFLVVIIVVFVAYSMTSNVIYGWKISSYKTFSDSLLTIISLQIGIFNYDEVLDSNPVLGGLLFGSCAVLVTFVLLNLFISVILVALQTEQLHHKPSEEEETVDIMLKIICNLFGIRHKTENVAPGPDMNGSSDVALNNAQICP
ncbi:unnamed protein product [Menidia menidia]|uniref:(Atlantic silverside) hypothetical protein n=1 Tax=Menidia menidia TaxID=238744 RepID=A0A8S4AGC9_9TELE|nr:unnamed protein product [Menidia menidia]